MRMFDSAPPREAKGRKLWLVPLAFGMIGVAGALVDNSQRASDPYEGVPKGPTAEQLIELEGYQHAIGLGNGGSSAATYQETIREQHMERAMDARAAGNQAECLRQIDDINDPRLFAGTICNP